MSLLLYLLAAIGLIAVLHHLAVRVAKALRRARLNSWDPFTKKDPFNLDH